MAKKRKTAKPRRRAKAARRSSPRRGKAGASDQMHAVFAAAVIVLLGIGVYFYQMNAPAGPVTAGNPSATAAAVDKK
jgi:hypothetical protein